MHDSNSRKVDVGMLTALHLMLEKRNITVVARDIGLSQPALSHALARMRRVFQDELFVRDGNTLVPTARALQLQEQLNLLMPDLHNLFTPASFDPSESHQVFKIAITDHAGQVLIPDFLRELTEQAPHVETRIAIIPNRETDVHDLDNRQFDLRIGWLRSLPPQWLKRKLCDDRIVLICSPDNQVVPQTGAPFSIEDFVKLQHVALESERPIYPNMIDSLLNEHGLTRNIVARVTHFSVVPFIVARSNLVAMFPERLARKFADRGIIRLVHPPVAFPDHDLSMAWHPRVHNDVAHVWLRKLIVECAARLSIFE